MSNNILDKIEERATGMQQRDDWGPRLAVDTRETETGRIEPRGFATQKEYAVVLKLAVTYWANDAERPDARRAARMALGEFLYADLRQHISMLRNAIWGGNREQAARWLEELQSKVDGK